MKAGAQFQKGTSTAVNFNAAFRGRSDPGENLQQGALAGPVPAYYAYSFAPFDLKGDIFEGPDVARRAGRRWQSRIGNIGAGRLKNGRVGSTESPEWRGKCVRETFSQGLVADVLAEPVTLAQVFDTNRDVTHKSWAPDDIPWSGPLTGTALVHDTTVRLGWQAPDGPGTSASGQGGEFNLAQGQAPHLAFSLCFFAVPLRPPAAKPHKAVPLLSGGRR